MNTKKQEPTSVKIKGVSVKKGEKQLLEVDKTYTVGVELAKILVSQGRAKIEK